jgi:Ser/Thr protein kinase RdoA (MazF antagonist)
MTFTPEQIISLAQKHFGLVVSVKPLPGEIDLNFYVKTASGEAFTLKIANPGERIENLQFQNRKRSFWNS